ncbi:MAG: ABC transporter ATP-binding protein [Pseudomonadota bacterium]
MAALIEARGVSKHFGDVRAVDDVSFNIERGRIVGLIGPNGAGKTTLLQAVLGLTSCNGTLRVCGHDPFRERQALMNSVSYVADVAVLPKWITVSRLLDYVATVHPKFVLSDAEAALRQTKIKPNAKVKALSKGMVAQLHLSIIMAIDAELLILDEPTLGLDILFRKSFYSELLSDYFNEDRTIIITTHQVEEIENILTDVMFIDDGKLVLDESLESIGEQYTELMASSEHAAAARALTPIAERSVFGQTVFTFAGTPRERLKELGEVRTPGLADLFVARISRERAA